MNVLIFLISFSLMVYLVHSQYKFNCYENYCSVKGNECPEFNCEDGRIVNNATTCGCCPLCIKNLNEGRLCKRVYLKWEKKIAECGPGLICKKKNETEGICEPSECLQRKRQYEKEYSADGKPLLEISFDCDHFGNFEPSDEDSSKPHVVCINDVLCFCVDKDGKRIFGTDFAQHNSSLSDMNCDCSRDIINFPTKKLNIEKQQGNFEKLPRCLPNGDYDPLQCVQGKCFCMNSRFSDEHVDAENMDKLSCYTSKRHSEPNLLTRCLKQLKNEIDYFRDKNATIIGADYTRCELDGTYYPLQCKNGRCSCVKRNGEEHIGFENIEKEEGDLKCRCMRDKEIIQSYEGEKTKAMKVFESIECDENYVSNYSIFPKSFVEDFIKH